MKINDKPGLELLAEFEEIKIDIEVLLDQSYVNYDLVEFFSNKFSDDPETLYSEWSFNLKFNNDFFVYSLDYGKPLIEYKDFIASKLKTFFREIGDVIEADSLYLDKMIILNDYKTSFELLSELYTEDVYHYCSIKENLLDQKNIKITKYQDKTISEYALKSIIDSFLKIQKQAISDILFYLNSKIDLLREVGDSESTNAKVKGSQKKLEPIKKLNKYQTALLFNYLIEVEAIHDLSAKKLAPLVSQLTGHSEQNLRTEALNNIFDIKTGKEGDKTELLKDADINLIKVRDIIKTILKKIDENLLKNRELRESKKL